VKTVSYQKSFLLSVISVVFVGYFTYKQNIPCKTICFTGNRLERKWLLRNSWYCSRIFLEEQRQMPNNGNQYFHWFGKN